MNEWRNQARSGSGEREIVEQSSETGSDFASRSESITPMSVIGTPSICVTTQTERSTTKHAKPVAQREERNAIRFIRRMRLV